MSEIDFLNDLEKFEYNKEEFFLWCEDDEIKIGFSQIPDIKELLINKTVMDKKEINEIKKKPFLLNNEIKVYLEDKLNYEIYTFQIDAMYRYDGASIPKFAWSVIGARSDVRFKVASLIHDVLCEHHEYVNNNRYFSTKVFERCCWVGGTCGFVRFLMFHCVDNFQKFQDW